MSIAYRGDGAGRPSSIPLPPQRVPMFRRSAMRKHWRYVGIWTPTVSICAARVRVGPLAQEFWGVWDRDTATLTEHSRLRAGRVHLSEQALRVTDGQARLEVALSLDPRGAAEVITPVGDAWTWTRKRPAQASGTVDVGGRRLVVEGPALLEDSDGYHPRLTHWYWAAGAGTLRDGRTALWNLVVGLNDTPPLIENTLWLDGAPHALGPVRISPDLARVDFDDGNTLHFRPEAERATSVDFLVVRSAYRQPFGTFTGTLPGGLVLERAHGVTEDHRALW